MRRLTDLLRNLLGLDDGATTTLSQVEDSRQRARWRIAMGAGLVLGAAAIIVAIVVSTISSLTSESAVPPELRLGSSATATDAPKDISHHGGEEIFVHVVGAVKNPGLYGVRSDARVIDAVMAAGGLGDTADPCAINLASSIQDGEQVVVSATLDGAPGNPALCTANSPAQDGTSTAGGPAGGAAGTSPGVISLSTASVAELDTLPGIGPALAQRIIDWRDASGGFSSVEQLGEVSGIGDKVLSNIRDLVTP